MSKYNITPWRTQSDLLLVRKQFYGLDGENADSRRTAVDRVMAWKLRGNLPHAVESTALLVDAILHHDITINSIFSIRAVYSAAFTRFVTGFCDIGRHKERSLEPSSMLDIAKQIGMPGEFVGLRHEATHEELPGIQRLVVATNQALEWLWGVYWSRLEVSEDDEVVKASLVSARAEMVSILRDFRRARRDALRTKAQPSAGEPGDIEATSSGCIDLCRGSRLKTAALASVFVDEKLMLPSSRELGSSMEGAFLIWDNLLQSLSVGLGSFVPALITSLQGAISCPATIDPESDATKEAYALWLLHLVQTSETENTLLRGILTDLMKWCCLHPGYWTQVIGEALLESHDQTGDLEGSWRSLFDASLINTDAAASEKNSPKPKPLGDGMEIVDDAHLSGDDRGASANGWSRMLVPIPAPIGVVR